MKKELLIGLVVVGAIVLATPEFSSGMKLPTDWEEAGDSGKSEQLNTENGDSGDSLMDSIKGFFLPPGELVDESINGNSSVESVKKEKQKKKEKKASSHAEPEMETSKKGAPFEIITETVDTFFVKGSGIEKADGSKSKGSKSDTSKSDTSNSENASADSHVVDQPEGTLIGSSAVYAYYTGEAAYNVELACSYNYGVYIPSGGEYSAFAVLGDGGADMGFHEADGLMADGSRVPMYGSGICPVTTAIYQAGRDAGLTILEANDHVGAASAYAAAGDQAMFNYPDSNLRMENDFGYAVELYVGYHDGVIYAEWYAL